MSGNYEDAPATKMLATHCACCGKPLVDAKSVECGVGPECRKRHGYDIDVPEELRKRANEIVHRIALNQQGKEVIEDCAALREMGFIMLADRILHRLKTIVITEENGRYFVKTPYDADAVRRFAVIPGRQWHKEEKLNSFPIESKRAIWTALRDSFLGCVAIGPKGVFEI